MLLIDDIMIMTKNIFRRMLLFITVGSISCNQQHQATVRQNNSDPSDYDKITFELNDITNLSKKADHYGMTDYVFCMLKPGIKKLMRKEEFDAMEKQHFSFIQSMADSGEIVLMGLYPNNINYNSFIIFTSADTTNAKLILSGSQKIAQQILIPEFHVWYGPVALAKLNAIHHQIMKVKQP
jgi:uncharacterized protein